MTQGSKVFRNLTRLHFAWEIEEYGWRIGEHSYGRPLVLDADHAGLAIGRFCSIGPDVTIVLGNHRTDLVSTYPFRTLSHLWKEAEDAPEDHEGRGDVVIGPDVWIGAKAMILPGTVIGAGAVVAGAAVVRGPVPPYAVVAGNPARIVRLRFDETTIARLLAVAWWHWDEAKLRSHLKLLTSGDINAFLDAAEADG